MEYSQEQEQILERLDFVGEEMERNIQEGKEIFLDEKDRLYLKGVLERNGRSLEPIKGPANLAQQAEDLVSVFSQIGDEVRRNQGCDGVSAMVANTVVSLLNSESGKVFDNGIEIGETEEERVSAFIRDFFDGFYEKNFVFNPSKHEKGSWERKTLYRIEAVLAVTNKVLWIAAAENEEEAKRRQNTPGVLKHLRERVIRGIEKEDKIEVTGIPRIDKDEVIRHLPKGGLSFILDTLGRL
jgi:hypothetical protein